MSIDDRKWLQKTLDCIDNIEQSSSLVLLKNHIDGIASIYGCTSIVIAKFPSAGETIEENVLINTRPRLFSSIYFEGGFDEVDPLLPAVVRSRSPLLWRDVYAGSLSKRQQELQAITHENDMRDGAAIPIMNISGAGIVSFAAPDHLHDGPAFRSMQLVSAYMFSKLLNFRRNIFPICLKPRERECLSWVAAGKSDYDIAEITGLSRHTVHVYIERAKTKLGCSNRTATVVEAIRRNEIFL